jgi:hypothetical protein
MAFYHNMVLSEIKPQACKTFKIKEIKARLRHRPSLKSGNAKLLQGPRSVKRRKRLLLQMCSSPQVLYLLQTAHSTRIRPEPTPRPLQLTPPKVPSLLSSRNWYRDVMLHEAHKVTEHNRSHRSIKVHRQSTAHRLGKTTHLRFLETH